METNNNYPIIGSDNESLDIINAFAPQLYELLRLNPESVSTLMLMYQKGNDKAGEIITYLVGKPVSYLSGSELTKKVFMESSSNHKVLQDYVGSYNITWGNFAINESDKNKILVEFDCDVLFGKKIWEGAFSTIITTKSYHDFPKNFLKKDVAQWLQEKGYKLRQYYPDKNKGRLYGNFSFFMYDPIPNPEYPGREDKYASHIRATCSFEIIPLN